ncbi:MAG: phosphoribosyltransferase [Aristaeellaceae bacterium]
MAIRLFETRTNNSNVPLRVAMGHYATSHSHINYYVDLTMTKHRLSEAREVATHLCSMIGNATVIDTILCLDGTEVIGACMASELTRRGFQNVNAHNTIYIVTPEHTTGSQLIFRENSAPMIVGKNVLVLAASVTTGYTVQAAVDAIRYYSGKPAGVCAIFSCVDECCDFEVKAVFTRKNDLPEYASMPSHECPMCQAGRRLDAMVNAFGVSSFT